jgi:hypothetical protein
MKTLEAREGMQVHFVHIAGTWMIELGIDGLSHGNLMEGVMDPTMLGSIPLHLGAFEQVQDTQLLDWFQDWMGLPEGLQPLHPKKWMKEGHGLTLKGSDSDLILMPTESGHRSFLWAPALAAVDVAINKLRKARHK